MLVVVALLSLLAGLVVPTLTGVLSLARKSVCANNLRQIHMAMLAYEADHDGHPILHINFEGYSLNNFVFHGLVYGASGHNANLAPLGYQGLGQLAGCNGTRREQLAGRLPERHYKYINTPSTFYCPSNQLGSRRQHTWTEMAYMKWDWSWVDWPTSSDYQLSTWIDYSLRYSTNTGYSPLIPNDRGLNAGPARGSVHIPVQQFTLIKPGHLFAGEAVVSDTNSSKLHVPACHGDGVNVVYRNGAVCYYQDTAGLLTTYNTLALWGYGRTNDTTQVNIWADYDARFNP